MWMPASSLSHQVFIEWALWLAWGETNAPATITEIPGPKVLLLQFLQSIAGAEVARGMWAGVQEQTPA